MTKQILLSVVLAVYNEEKNLERCLTSVNNIADEIIIIDGGSSDNTVQIAKSYGARIVMTDNPPIFHINKQKGVDLAKGEWILQLDADEEVNESLKQEIILRLAQDKLKYCGYYIPRKNYFCGKWMKHGGMWPDPVIRLFKNGKGHFPCKTVHEQIAIDGNTAYLKEPLNHYSYLSLEEYKRKNKSYVQLESKLIKNEMDNSSILFHLYYVIIKPINTFFTLYIRLRGFLDGSLGIIWALNSALVFPRAYVLYRRSN